MLSFELSQTERVQLYKMLEYISTAATVYIDLKTLKTVYTSFADDLLNGFSFSLKTGTAPDLLKIGHSSPLLKQASLKGYEFNFFQKSTKVSILSKILEKLNAKS